MESHLAGSEPLHPKVKLALNVLALQFLSHHKGRNSILSQQEVADALEQTLQDLIES